MTESFDAERDRQLGDLLRHLLSADDDAGFAARVVARLDEQTTLRDQLARWARPGVAAAILAAVLAGYWLGVRGAAAPLGEPPAELAATDRPLNGDDLMGVMLGSTR